MRQTDDGEIKGLKRKIDSCEADNRYNAIEIHATVLLRGYYTSKCIALGSLHTGSVVSDESKLGRKMERTVDGPRFCYRLASYFDNNSAIRLHPYVSASCLGVRP